MESLIPEFSWHGVFVDPWVDGFGEYVWIWLMGWLMSATCGVVGSFLILRRMALVGDAISHSVLPGLVVAFLITGSLEGPVMLIGAAVAGMLTTVLIELIHQNSRVKADAALGIVFASLFALGVILITVFAGNVHLDVNHVLYGALEFVPFEDAWEVAGVFVPYPVLQMGWVALGVLGMTVLFYKELLVTSFDATLGQSLGMPVRSIHFTLMAVLAVVVVSAFSAVGAILVIAMLIFPGSTMMLLSDRLPRVLFGATLLGGIYAIGGLHLALFLGCSIAGAMVVVALFVFILAWVLSPHRGLLGRWRKRRGEVGSAVHMEQFDDLNASKDP
ncbi:MAG: metal ABC transporter permease [Opitutales bacterium]|nr:metal ABC transporter permease [Opitutales bacterium]NRA27122.1 metal ABC transporter permease [Opitutales bacterium]